MSAQVIVIEKPADLKKQDELERLLSPYGEVVYLFNSAEKPVPVWDIEFSEHVRVALEEVDYCPLTDYVALVGSNMLVAILVHAARMHDDYDQTTINALSYHPSKGGSYRILPLPGE